MADDKRIEGRTTYIEENMPDGMLKKAVVGISRLVFTPLKSFSSFPA